MARDYGRIFTNFWNSPDVRPLSDHAKLLAAYLLTSPHSNIIGAYLLPDSYISDDMAWPLERVTQTLSELMTKGFCQRFQDRRHIAICRYLVWNSIENGNVLKAAYKQADALPDDPALFHVVKGLEPYAKRFGNSSETVWQTLRERLPEPFRNMEMEMEMEMEPEPDISPAPQLAGPVTPSKRPSSERAKTPKPSTDQSSDFEIFWSGYPRKKNRKEAEKAFARAIKRASLAKILAGVQRYAIERKDEPERFTRHAATWLNNDCWSDGGAAPEKANGHADAPADEWTLSAEDILLAKVFGGVATDVLIYRRGKIAWPEFMHGPRPDDPKTKIDPVVLSRHGYADAAIYERWKEAHPA